MERVRCAKYERIRQKWDTEIEGQSTRATTCYEALNRTIAERKLRAAQISKARSLNTHLIRCLVCR